MAKIDVDKLPAYRKLDLTDCKLTGIALMIEMNNRFRETQRLIIRPYPGHLFVTKKQRDDLAKTNRVPRKWWPKVNKIGMDNGMIMEIHVVDEGKTDESGY